MTGQGTYESLTKAYRQVAGGGTGQQKGTMDDLSSVWDLRRELWGVFQHQDNVEDCCEGAAAASEFENPMVRLPNLGQTGAGVGDAWIRPDGHTISGRGRGPALRPVHRHDREGRLAGHGLGDPGFRGVLIARLANSR